MIDSHPLDTHHEAMLTPGEQRFEHIRKQVGLWLGPVLFILLMLFPIPGLTPEAAKLAAVLALTLTWWMCEPVPIPITAILAPALCVILGIAGAKELFASFGDPIVFLFIGGFILAEAMMVHGLDRRIALGLLGIDWVANSVPRVFLVFGAIAAFLSMWLSNTATTAMMAPIALGIVGEMGEMLARQKTPTSQLDHTRLATGLMLILAYGASIGGLGTPIGTPPNLIGIGLIRDQLAVDITFVNWMMFALPAVVVMFLALYFIILLMYRPTISKIEGLAEYLEDRKQNLGPWTRGQINTLVAFFTAVVLWVLPGVLALLPGEAVGAYADRYDKIMPEGVVAVVAAGLLFLLPINIRNNEFTLTWKQAVRIDWGTILLFGGGIALGKLAFSTGLAEHVGQGILQGTNVSSLGMITLLAIIFGIFISETTSNTASATMVIPVAISVAQAAKVDALAPALGACMGASFGFMLPVSTPPNAIVYGTGYVPITRMVKTGLIFDILGAGVIWVTVMTLSGILR